MAAVPHQRPEVSLDRRMVPRSELSLGVTLHRVGEQEVIPAAIANLSATGFLAELPDGASLPEFLDVDLPNAGRRQAQVVWQGGTLAGCNFIHPLGRADLSAARLKSTFVEPEPATPAACEKVAPVFEIGPSDPIWDMLNEGGSGEKLSLRARLVLIGAAAIVAWAPLVGIALVLA